eukprot:Hpha_TRINITY_DN16859_c1_g4::TRINITY_DN16859_c1_g4_i1::g.152513::m.152513
MDDWGEVGRSASSPTKLPTDTQDDELMGLGMFAGLGSPPLEPTPPIAKSSRRRYAPPDINVQSAPLLSMENPSGLLISPTALPARNLTPERLLVHMSRLATQGELGPDDCGRIIGVIYSVLSRMSVEDQTAAYMTARDFLGDEEQPTQPVDQFVHRFCGQEPQNGGNDEQKTPGTPGLVSPVITAYLPPPGTAAQHDGGKSPTPQQVDHLQQHHHHHHQHLPQHQQPGLEQFAGLQQQQQWMQGMQGGGVNYSAMLNMRHEQEQRELQLQQQQQMLMLMQQLQPPQLPAATPLPLGGSGLLATLQGQAQDPQQVVQQQQQQLLQQLQLLQPGLATALQQQQQQQQQ